MGQRRICRGMGGWWLVCRWIDGRLVGACLSLVSELTEDLSVGWWWLVVGRLLLAVGGQFIQNLFSKS